jgi:hypothetical protein
MPIRESRADTTIEYQVEPAVLAEVCQDVLNRIGSVKTVSRESGTISGKVSSGLFAAANISLRIAKKGDLTELSIQTSRGEGTLSSGGAEKALAIFTQTLGKDARLAGKATGGW